MSDIKFNFLGNPDIYYKNQSIINRLSSKSLALLAYLIINNKKTYTRDQLACLLWADSNKEAAYSNLRYNFWFINKTFKKMIDQEIIYTKKDKIKIKDNFNYSLDVETLKNLECKHNLKDLEKVNVIYKGSFLEGFYLKKCVEYNDWVFYERESIQRTFFEVLERLNDIYVSKEMYDESIELLENFLKINPYDEDIYVKLIKLFLKTGDRNSALTFYNKCVNVLREELNVSPKDSTKKLLKQIKNYNKPTKVKSAKDFIALDKKSFEERYLKYKTQEYFNFYINHQDIALDYFSLNALLKEIYKTTDHQFIQSNISPIYLQEIAKLCIIYENLIDEKSNTLSFSKIRLFDSVLELLLAIARVKKIKIFIKNFNLLDQQSKVFFKYMTHSLTTEDISIIITKINN